MLIYFTPLFFLNTWHFKEFMYNLQNFSLLFTVVKIVKYYYKLLNVPYLNNNLYLFFFFKGPYETFKSLR